MIVPRWYARAAVGLVLVILCLAAGGRAALAHPLGNFTVNHYARVELSGDALRLRYVLDLAEVPSVQETRAADTQGLGQVTPAEWDAYKERKAADLISHLDLVIDNQPVQLRPTDVAVSQPLGQGDIPLVRLEMWLEPVSPVAPNIDHVASFRDRSDPARLGWREIVVHAGSGATLADSSVPAQDVTDELRSYPDDLLQNPLDRREAHWTFNMDGSASQSAAVTANVANRPTDPLAELVTASDLNPTVVLLALLAAALLGGIHAASPGHGKSIMAAYIVGTRGTVLHAAALAISVTLAHTTGVLALGILTVLASNLIFPDQLYPWLTLVSGALVLVLGARFLVTAIRRGETPDHHDHDHDHHHNHDHRHDNDEGHHDHSGHGHIHKPVGGRGLAPTWRGLFALGLAGGIVPSGSALVVLLSSVALGRLGFGLVLIVAFGLGMAVVLVSTGILVVHAGRLMLRLFPEDAGSSNVRRRLGAAVPVISASVMTLLGIVATFEGLTQMKLIGF